MDDRTAAPAPTVTTVHHLVDRRFVGITPDSMRIMMDGENEAQTGMRPMQLVLNAVGACAAYDIVAMIGKRRLAINDYRIELSGERSSGTPAYFTHIHAVHHMDVPGLTQEQAERFVELGMTRYCSVAASLKAEITFEVVLKTETGQGALNGLNAGS